MNKEDSEISFESIYSSNCSYDNNMEESLIQEKKPSFCYNCYLYFVLYFCCFYKE